MAQMVLWPADTSRGLRLAHPGLWHRQPAGSWGAAGGTGMWR